MVLQVAFKHQLKLSFLGDQEKIIGDAISFHDGCFSKDRPLASSLTIHKLVSKAECADQLVRSKKLFYLGVNDTKESNTGVVNLLKTMTQSSQYALCYYDKVKSEAVFIPFSQEERAQTGYKCGFLCRIINDKNTVNTQAIPPPQPSRISWGTNQTQFISPYEAQPEDRQPRKRPYEEVGHSSSSSSNMAMGTGTSPYDMLSAATATGNPYSAIPSYSLPSTASSPYQSLYTNTNINTDTNTNTNSNAAQSHYNQLKRNRETRHESQILHLRNLNNFIKMKSMETVTQCLLAPLHPLAFAITQQSHGLHVLDLACGKGGDVMKWWRNEVALRAGVGVARYVGADIAEESLREFVTERILTNHTLLKGEQYRKITQLIHCNLSEDSLSQSECLTHTWPANGYGNHHGGPNGQWTVQIPLSPTDTFHVISCQFAVHYMFSTAATASHFFTEVHRHLQPGGYFFATTIDCRVLTHYLVKGLYGPQGVAAENHLQTDSIAGLTVETEEIPMAVAWGNPTRAQKVVRVCLANEFGKRLLTIQLTADMVDRLLFSTTPSPATGTEREEKEEDWFGLEYRFILQDSEEENAVNAPEWLVPIGQPFHDMLQTVGLRVHSVENFHEFIASRSHDPLFQQKMKDMEVFNIAGRLSDVEWNIARLYCVIIVEKPTTMSNATPTIIAPNTTTTTAATQSLSVQAGARAGDYLPHSPASSPPHTALSAQRLATLRQLVHFTQQQRHSIDCPPSSPPLTQPSTPDYPPESDSDTDEEDAELMRILQIRSQAKELFGGDDDAWDGLADDVRDAYIAQATTLIDGTAAENKDADFSMYE